MEFASHISMVPASASSAWRTATRGCHLVSTAGAGAGTVSVLLFKLERSLLCPRPGPGPGPGSGDSIWGQGLGCRNAYQYWALECVSAADVRCIQSR